MTAFDYVIITIIAASVMLGIWRGVVGEIIALLAWVVAFFAARLFGEEVAGRLLNRAIADPVMQLVAAWVAIFIVVLMLMALLRLAIRGLLKALGLSPMDRFLGMFFGVARGLLIVLLLVALAGMTMVPKEKWWVEAMLSAPLETAVIAAKPWMPQEVAKRIRFR